MAIPQRGKNNVSEQTLNGKSTTEKNVTPMISLSFQHLLIMMMLSCVAG